MAAACPWLGLFHERVSQAQFVGTGGCDKFLERGKLCFPAKLADLAVCQDAWPANSNAVELAVEFLANHMQGSLPALTENCLGRDPVNPSCAEQGRRVHDLRAYRVKVARFDPAATDDLYAAGNDRKEVMQPCRAFPAIVRDGEAMDYPTLHLRAALDRVGLKSGHVVLGIATAPYTSLEMTSDARPLVEHWPQTVAAS